MLEQLRAWLNGDRDYYAGVVLYSVSGDNPALLQLFANGKTEYCEQRLQEELLQICKQLKHRNGLNSESHSGEQSASVSPVTTANVSRNFYDGGDGLQNGELYEACKHEANQAYKEIMNLRAELFAAARADDCTDPNTPDKIAQRSKIAVKVADGFKHVSQLYDRADYVKLHGRLPADGRPDDEELDANGLPEHLVKFTLDNLRKNVSKMKKRPASPERIELLQKHEANIKRLEARWHSLQPAK